MAPFHRASRIDRAVSIIGMKEKKKVMINGKIKEKAPYKELFPSSIYAPLTIYESVVEAKHKLASEHFDLIWIQGLLQVQQAKEIAMVYNTMVLLFVKATIYDQVAYQMRDARVFVFSFPISRSTMSQVVSMVEQFSEKTKTLERKLFLAQKKLKDIKIIDRCKMELMHYFHWNEDKAHHYMEKCAMDQGVSKLQIAHTILAKLELKKEANA